MEKTEKVMEKVMENHGIFCNLKRMKPAFPYGPSTQSIIMYSIYLSSLFLCLQSLYNKQKKILATNLNQNIAKHKMGETHCVLPDHSRFHHQQLGYLPEVCVGFESFSHDWEMMWL